jgi:hypothetical protein
MSSFKGHHIAELDSLMIPWGLETFEEQGLLAQTANVVFQKDFQGKRQCARGWKSAVNRLQTVDVIVDPGCCKGGLSLKTIHELDSRFDF